MSLRCFQQLRGEVFDQIVNADQVAGVKVCTYCPPLLTCNLRTRENDDWVQTALFCNEALLVFHIKGFENANAYQLSSIFTVDPISEIKQHSERFEAWRSDSFYWTNWSRKNHSTE